MCVDKLVSESAYLTSKPSTSPIESWSLFAAPPY